MSDTKNIRLGVCNAYFGATLDPATGALTLGTDLGYTQGGVEVTVSTDTHPVNVDQYGKSTVAEYIMKRDIKIKVPMAETTLDNLALIMPGVSLTGSATATSGFIGLTSLPTDGDTFTVNGGTSKTYTFKTTASVATDIAIGTTISATIENIRAKLAADLSSATWAVAKFSGKVTIKAIAEGATALSISSTAPGIQYDVSLGIASNAGVKRCATVSNGVGVNLLSDPTFGAKGLLLRPVDKQDGSEDLFVPLANTAGAMNFAYMVDKERIFNAEFTGYPYTDANGNSYLFKLGDVTGV